MLIPIPMELSAKPDRPRLPVANTTLIAVTAFASLLFRSSTWWVGPGTAPWTVLTYGFVHASFLHLLFNMWYLWVFGNAVNRRVGDKYYLLTYLGSIVLVGLVCRLACPGYVVGSSGAVYAVLGVALLLLPSAKVDVHYVAIFPLTLLMGLLRRPRYGLFWFLRWGTLLLPAIVLIGAYVLLEFFWLGWSVFGWGMSWSNLGHLLGFFCGIGAVLLLPRRITMSPGVSFSSR